MYRRTMIGQLQLDIPFGTPLDANNRWVRLAGILPWEKIEEKYAENFKGECGQVAKSGRLAFGALYIQGRLAITDEELVMQIQETPSMQYFCGFGSYSPEKPFDSSLLVHFRKRIPAEMVKEIAEEAFVAEAKKAIELEESKNNSDDEPKIDSDNNSNNIDNSDNNDTASGNKKEPKPKGTLLLDATCCPSDIRYPTDINLLNHARELLEQIIDGLHHQQKHLGIEKPRTYRDGARKNYMDYIKKRSHTEEEIRFTIRQQLQYVHRNLDTIEKQVESGAKLELLDGQLNKKLPVIAEVYRQQKQMYDEKTHQIEDRIVSIAQPHIRPIVRGKAGAPVEFGTNVATAHIGGFTFVIHMGYDNFSESTYLEKSAEEYKRMFGFYPKVIVGDKAYATNDNRKYCKSKGIRLSAPKRGRKSDCEKELEKKQLYEDNCKRNAVEGDYGVTKRKYGLDLVMTKLQNTTLTVIAFAFFIKNMERILRLFVLRFFLRRGKIWCFERRLFLGGVIQ